MGEGGGSCRPSAGTRPCPPAGRPGRAGPAAPAGGGRVSEVGREALASPDTRSTGSRGSPTCASLLSPRPARPAPAEPRCTPKAPASPRSPRLSTAEPCFYLSCRRSGGGIFQHPPSGQVIPAEKGRTCRPGGAQESAGRSQAPAPRCEREPGLRGAGSDRRGIPHGGSAAGSGHRHPTATAAVCGAQREPCCRNLQ